MTSPRGLYADDVADNPWRGVWICGHSFVGPAWPTDNAPGSPSCLRTVAVRCEFCGELRIFVYCDPWRRMVQGEGRPA
jgi:hypothetical protein